jgi:ABC-type sugar transport system substrate-binding protein
MLKKVLKAVPVGLAVLAVVAVAGCGEDESGSTGGGSASADEKYKVYLSNSYMGEGYRVQMMKAARAAVKRAPLKDRVDLKIVISEENTPASQAASIQNMILQKPDAIAIVPSAGPALEPVIKRACDSKIVVVVYDSAIDGECNTSIQPDWSTIGKNWGTWMVETLDGQGTVALDTGLAGVPLSKLLVDGFKEGIAGSDIEIVSEFESQFAPGPEQKGVASALAANSDLDAVVVQGAGQGAFNAFKAANKDLKVFAGFSYNGALVYCAENKDTQCHLGSAPNYQSAQAIYDAFQKLEGKQVEKLTLIDGGCFSTNGINPEGKTCDDIVAGKNAFPDQPFDLTLPVSPPWAKPPFTVEEVTTATG